MMLRGKIEPFIKDLRGALHVGANVGEEADWYQSVGFQHVLWFEPNRELFPILSVNIKKYPHQHAVAIGIHDTLKEGVLHISNNAGQSSSLLELGLHTKYHPDVKYIEDRVVKLDRLDHFLEDAGMTIKDFSFVNIDVQGTELNVLKSLGDLLGRLEYVYLEVNDNEVYKGCALLPEIDSYLESFNFIRIKTKMTNAHWGDAFYIKEK